MEIVGYNELRCQCDSHLEFITYFNFSQNVHIPMSISFPPLKWGSFQSIFVEVVWSVISMIMSLFSYIVIFSSIIYYEFSVHTFGSFQAMWFLSFSTIICNFLASFQNLSKGKWLILPKTFLKLTNERGCIRLTD